VGAPTERPVVRHCPNPDCGGLARDGVVAEYREPLTECLDCGATLAAGERPAAAELATEYVDLVTVFIASGIAQGQVVASAVEAAGIPVFLKGEHLVGAVGELPTTVAQLEVQVPLERRDEARASALEWERPGSGADHSGAASATSEETAGPATGEGSSDDVHGVVAAALAEEDDADRTD